MAEEENENVSILLVGAVMVIAVTRDREAVTIAVFEVLDTAASAIEGKVIAQITIRKYLQFGTL